MYGLAHLIMHINSLERVQRHFTKRITELHDLSYQERLTVLNLETLEYQRLSSDLTIKFFIISLLGLQMITLTLLFHHIIFILFIMISTFVSHCVILIYLRMIFLTTVSLHGIVCLVLSLIQSLLLRLSVLLYLLICPNFWSLLFRIASYAECYFTW